MMNERKEIQRLLKSLGITPNRRGYDYLIEAITLVNENYPKKMNLSGDVYARISERFDEELANIERCIRSAIEHACHSMQATYLAEMLGAPMRLSKGKYTSAEFIALCAEKIRTYREGEI